MTDVYLEQGRTWTFACAVDWPGWARPARNEDDALETLASYAERYGPTPGPRGGKRWPAAYAVRRMAWHVTDHMWEIEDKTPKP